MKKHLYLLIMIISVIAWCNALYLSYHGIVANAQPLSFVTSDLFCDLSSTFSCSEVLKSPYAQVFWLPFPAIAVLVYPVLFCIALVWYILNHVKSARLLTVLSLGGMLFNGYFVSVELFYIWAFCPLCIICSAIITTIFICSIIIWKFDTTKKRA